MWRRKAPLHRYKYQGPAINAIDLAMNDTELYTLDSTSKIPFVYRLSFSDMRKTIWMFDIRTLVHSMGTGFPSQNPYTRDEFTEQTMKRIHARIAWLRSRKYHILHANTDVLTADQLWNQAVLDIFLKIESLGYYVSCDWYHAMSKADHYNFYKKMYDLWEYRLGLTRSEKEHIIPGPYVLFRFDADDAFEKSKNWWAKKNLILIEAFITKGHDKEYKKLGTMYVLMGFVQVSTQAAAALPWVVAATS